MRLWWYPRLYSPFSHFNLFVSNSHSQNEIWEILNFLWRLLLNQNLWRAEKKKWIPVCIKEQKYQLFSRTLVKTIELYLQFFCPATHFEKIQVELSPSLKNIFLRKLKDINVILQRLFSSSWSISQNIVITKIYVHTDYYGTIFSKSQRLVFKFLAFVYWSTPGRGAAHLF